VVKRRKTQTLPAVRPNCGLEALYRKKLKKLIDEMHCSVIYWLRAEYKQHEGELVFDASPVVELRKALRLLSRRWQKRFNEASHKLAKYFAQSASQRTDKQLQSILGKAGFTVEFKLTQAQQNVLKATVAANVALIKSIPQKYLHDVEQKVMVAVQQGGKLGDLTKSLQATYGVTKRRAALIARDQNNKATSALQRQRQIELNISQAIWLHSLGGKHPRKTHIANDGKRYDVGKGWYDPDEKKFIFPGQLINCRCTSRSVIPGYMFIAKPNAATLQMKEAAEKRAK
jgi:uncharacterized protein with gpF-like domain